MIADFVIAVFSFLFFAAATIVPGILAGAVIWCIPAMIHDAILNEDTDGWKGYFFGIFVVALPIIFGVMTSYTVGNWFYETDKEREANKPLPVVVLAEEVHRIQLIEIDPPKHVYADFVNLTTGETVKRAYVSKHCNNYRQNTEGDEFNVRVTRKKQGDKEFVEYNDLYSVFCGN
jgi:hypothetical protein